MGKPRISDVELLDVTGSHVNHKQVTPQDGGVTETMMNSARGLIQKN